MSANRTIKRRQKKGANKLKVGSGVIIRHGFGLIPKGKVCKVEAVEKGKHGACSVYCEEIVKEGAGASGWYDKKDLFLL